MVAKQNSKGDMRAAGSVAYIDDNWWVQKKLQMIGINMYGGISVAIG